MEVIDRVLVKDEEEQRRVERYLKELYEFPSKEDYHNFLDGFIIQDKQRGADEETKGRPYQV